jgi:hypothetical protein
VADSFSVEVTNQAAFDAALAGIAHDLADMAHPMADTGAAVLAAARAGAPRRTGRMADAHQGAYVGPNRYRITVAHPGANAVHWGWPRHGIRREPWVVARFWRDQTWSDRLAGGIQNLLDTHAGKAH